MENVVEIVKEMNEALFHSECAEHDYMHYLELVQTPIGDYVKYMGCYIWDSENDYRDYILDENGDPIDEQEPLKEYIFNQMSLIKRTIYKSMLAIEKTLE